VGLFGFDIELLCMSVCVRVCDRTFGCMYDCARNEQHTGVCVCVCVCVCVHVRACV